MTSILVLIKRAERHVNRVIYYSNRYQYHSIANTMITFKAEENTLFSSIDLTRTLLAFSQSSLLNLLFQLLWNCYETPLIWHWFQFWTKSCFRLFNNRYEKHHTIHHAIFILATTIISVGVGRFAFVLSVTQYFDFSIIIQLHQKWLIRISFNNIFTIMYILCLIHNKQWLSECKLLSSVPTEMIFFS